MKSSVASAWLMSRASGVDMNPMTISQRAATFAATAADLGAVTLLVRRTETGLSGHLLTPASAAARQAATHLAHAVGASAAETELPALDSETVVGCLAYERGSVTARETQAGVDPAEVARLLANTVPLDGWVAIVMRRPVKAERKRAKAWLAHRLNTAVPQHHSMASEAMVCSIYAGADDAASVRTLLNQVAAVLPGFDVPVRPRVLGRARVSGPWFAAAAATAAAGAGLQFGVGFDLFAESLLFAGPAALAGALRAAGTLPSSYSRARSGLASAALPVPGKRRGSAVRMPNLSDLIFGQKEDAGAPEPDYPLSEDAFLLGPQVVVGVVAPQAGAISGDAATKSRAVPPVMLGRIGPLIGDTDAGPAHLSAVDARYGVAILGTPGSGKSVLSRSLFAWSCLERVAPSGKDGFPGARNAIIAFESKGDGVTQYQRWADATGDVMLVVDLADPHTPAIDMFAVPGNAAERAAFFINAMVYAFGEGAIQDRSFETLSWILPAALVTTPELAARVPGLRTDASPLYYAAVLLQSYGDALAVGLANEVMAEAVRPGAHPDVVDAAAKLVPLFQGKTENARNTRCEAPRSKISQLAAFEAWWTPERRKVTWSQILNKHRVVVINTGSSLTGQIVDEKLSQQMSSLLMFSLRNALLRHCSTWLDEGRSVSLFADELSLLAGHSPEVLTWIRNQGRSYGLRPFFATQYLEQLPQPVRKALLTFSTLISYRQEDQQNAHEVAEAVSAAKGEWTSEDVLLLEPYTAVVRAGVNQRRQPAFTVKVRNFEADRSVFAADQGYTPTTAPVAATNQHLQPAFPADEATAPVFAEPVTPAPLVIADVEDDGTEHGLMSW